jgi:hypothetical protein
MLLPSWLVRVGAQPERQLGVHSDLRAMPRCCRLSHACRHRLRPLLCLPLPRRCCWLALVRISPRRGTNRLAGRRAKCELKPLFAVLRGHVAPRLTLGAAASCHIQPELEDRAPSFVLLPEMLLALCVQSESRAREAFKKRVLPRTPTATRRRGLRCFMQEGWANLCHRPLRAARCAGAEGAQQELPLPLLLRTPACRGACGWRLWQRSACPCCRAAPSSLAAPWGGACGAVARALNAALAPHSASPPLSLSLRLLLRRLNAPLPARHRAVRALDACPQRPPAHPAPAIHARDGRRRRNTASAQSTALLCCARDSAPQGRMRMMRRCVPAEVSAAA